MTLIILREAEEELAASAFYYRSKQPGLGVRLRQEVAAVVDWILHRSEVPRLRPKGYRRVNLRVFPHYIAYIVRGDTIWVVQSHTDITGRSFGGQDLKIGLEAARPGLIQVNTWRNSAVAWGNGNESCCP